MHIKPMDNSQWPAIQEIYKEAFPKSGQKPFFLLKRPVRSGKAQLWTAEEDGQLLGFLLANIWKDLVLQHVVEISGGQMEVLRWGGPVTAEEYLGIQRHAMGALLYRLSHTRVLPAVT